MLHNKLKVYYVEIILTAWYSKYYKNIKNYENKGMFIMKSKILWQGKLNIIK